MYFHIKCFLAICLHIWSSDDVATCESEVPAKNTDMDSEQV